jgi:hypothetical protein
LPIVISKYLHMSREYVDSPRAFWASVANKVHAKST